MWVPSSSLLKASREQKHWPSFSKRALLLPEKERHELEHWPFLAFRPRLKHQRFFMLGPAHSQAEAHTNGLPGSQSLRLGLERTHWLSCVSSSPITNPGISPSRNYVILFLMINLSGLRERERENVEGPGGRERRRERERRTDFLLVPFLWRTLTSIPYKAFSTVSDS